MSNDGVFEAILGWIWPAGPVVACAAATLTAIVLARRLAGARTDGDDPVQRVGA